MNLDGSPLETTTISFDFLFAWLKKAGFGDDLNIDLLGSGFITIFSLIKVLSSFLFTNLVFWDDVTVSLLLSFKLFFIVEFIPVFLAKKLLLSWSCIISLFFFISSFLFDSNDFIFSLNLFLFSFILALLSLISGIIQSLNLLLFLSGSIFLLNFVPIFFCIEFFNLFVLLLLLLLLELLFVLLFILTFEFVLLFLALLLLLFSFGLFPNFFFRLIELLFPLLFLSLVLSLFFCSFSLKIFKIKRHTSLTSLTLSVFKARKKLIMCSFNGKISSLQ